MLKMKIEKDYSNPNTESTDFDSSDCEPSELVEGSRLADSLPKRCYRSSSSSSSSYLCASREIQFM